MKKITAVLISIVFLCMPFSCFANNATEQFIYSNGELEVHYYLDDQGRPYCYENGEIVYMLLLTETNRLPEEESDYLNSLIEGYEEVNEMARAAPTSWYDMSSLLDGVNPKSVTYETFVNFDLMSQVVTPPLKVNSHLVNLNIVSANMEKKLFSGKLITVKIEFYDKINDAWGSVTYTDNYTGEGKNYIFSPSVMPFVRITTTKSSSGVKNFDLQVLTWGTA